MPLSISLRLNTLLLVLLVTMASAILALLATRAYGGGLDPGGPPASTMKSLDDIPGSWSRKLDSTNGAPANSLAPPPGCNSTRFRCVLTVQTCFPQFCFDEYPAVLDEETGLVWERVPSGSLSIWNTAARYCEQSATTAQRLGWRLATAPELMSLMDSATMLPPAGSPFSLSDGEGIWSATTRLDDATVAFYLSVGHGLPGTNKNLFAQARPWCVRGPGGVDGL